MLFRKKMQRLCAHCAFGGKIDEDTVICRKCGVVPSGHQCRRFRYDPLKRIPPKPAKPDLACCEDQDFSL